MSEILNATPMNYYRGDRDLSARDVTPEKPTIAQVVPLIPILSDRGTDKAESLTLGEAKVLYGEKAFDKLSDYYRHSTLLAEILGGTGNKMVFKRLKPETATAKVKTANVTLCLETIEADMPNYQRNSDGSIIKDAAGVKQVDGANPTIPGVGFRWVYKVDTTGAFKQGQQTQVVGDWDIGGTKSNIFPIMEVEARYFGKYYNNVGITLDALSKEAMDGATLTEGKFMPYNFYIMDRKDVKSSTKAIANNFGQKYTKVALKSKAVDPKTKDILDILYKVPNLYDNKTDVTEPIKEAPIGKPYVYYKNLDNILKTVATAENAHVTTTTATWADGKDANTFSWYDFSGDDATTIEDEKYLFNIITGKSSKNIPYFTFVKDTAATATAGYAITDLGSLNPVFLGGGEDGLIVDDKATSLVDEATVAFEDAVIALLDEYADRDSRVNSLALNVDSLFVDSGYTSKVRDILYKYILIRPDTRVIAGTQEFGKYPNTAAEDRAIGVGLITKLRAATESAYFGTTTVRAAVAIGSGNLVNDYTYDILPATFELAYKTFAYCGAGSREWDYSKRFVGGDDSKFTVLKNIQPDFIPNTSKYDLFSNSLTYPENYDRVNFFNPSLQTVYDDDTSVNNNWLVAIVIGYLNRLSFEAWRSVAGDERLSRNELKDKVIEYMKDNTKYAFDDETIAVLFDVIFTKADLQRGYSWDLVSKLGAHNSHNVQMHTIESYRFADLKNNKGGN